MILVLQLPFCKLQWFNHQILAIIAYVSGPLKIPKDSNFQETPVMTYGSKKSASWSYVELHSHSHCCHQKNTKIRDMNAFFLCENDAWKRFFGDFFKRGRSKTSFLGLFLSLFFVLHPSLLVSGVV